MRLSIFLSVVCLLNSAKAIWLDTNNLTTIQEATALISQGLLDYYEGFDYGGTIGMFVWPYYWWEAGGAWGSLIDYTYYLQNDTYVDIIKEALLYQTGSDDNYIPLNQSTTEGNDDQGFWGIAVMAAAEKNFSNPSDDSKSWLALAQAVFNTMSARWDSSCGGGLRWQIFQWNQGYDYKNSVSNGCMFNIGARLARYTANDTYVDWSERIWEWMEDSGLVDMQWGYVYDGMEIDNCTDVIKYQWTYNVGLMLSGSAFLYNYTEETIWLNRTLKLLEGASVFFKNDIMYEAACQPGGTCDEDQRSFKAFFSRFLGLTSVMVPQTEPTITKWLVASANGAAVQCSGGTDYHTCGQNWGNSTWDGVWGLGEQMSALEVIQNLLVHTVPPPYTASDGGSSIGNPAAGYGEPLTNTDPLDLTTADKAGAGIITAIIAIAIIATSIWLVI